MPQSTIDGIELDTSTHPALLLTGTGPAPVAVTLTSARWQQREPVDIVDDGRWRGRIPLTAARWHGPELPLPSGRYRVEFEGGIQPRLDAAGPADVLVPRLLRLTVDAAADGLQVTVGAPLTDDERGPAAQRQLEDEYHASRPTPLNAVFFESFYGANVSCNPLAIDRALAELAPDVTRYWSVADASVAVPDGAVSLIEGSAEWWRIRAAARLLVVNDWLRKRYRSRPHQTVLQTWHGTPLKRIAIGRRGFRPRAAIATLRERSRWDVMLAQNEHSTRVFRRSYAFRGPIWELGYPRDDVLVSGDGAAIRERLDIPAGNRVLLYAPTWRDDRPDEVDHLDVAALAAELGDGYTVLVRGHARTLQPGRDVRAHGVLDVTGYPDVSELFLAADALITDYSSVMFDFTVTGKPVLFHTPDLADYRDRLRGFTFDLLAHAPGPVVDTIEALLARIRDLNGVATEFAGPYRAWQQRFNPHDDGGASARVVQRLLAQRMIG